MSALHQPQIKVSTVVNGQLLADSFCMCCQATIQRRKSSGYIKAKPVFERKNLIEGIHDLRNHWICQNCYLRYTQVDRVFTYSAKIKSIIGVMKKRKLPPEVIDKILKMTGLTPLPPLSLIIK